MGFLKTYHLDKFLLILFPLLFNGLYYYKDFNFSIIRGGYLLFFTGVLLLFFFKYLSVKIGSITEIVKWIVFLILTSIISAYFFWQQDFDLTYRITIYFLGIIYFFLLLELKPNIRTLESLIFVFTSIYILVWISSLIAAPNILFSADPEKIIDESRGFFRINLEGYCIILLAYFLTLNKVAENKNSKIWIAVLVVLFIIIILHLIRQLIIVTIFVTLLYVLKKMPKTSIVVGSIGLFVFFWGINSTERNITKDDSIVGSLVNSTVNQYEKNKDDEKDIRIRSFEFYTKKYSPHEAALVFGNGVPHIESNYGKTARKNNLENGFYISDVGYAEIFVYFGIPTLILFFILLYITVKSKVISKLEYSKLFLYSIFILSVASHPFITDAPWIAIALYIVEYNNWQHKKKFLKKIKSC